MAAEVRVPIAGEADIVTARQKGRELAAAGGFSRTEQTLIATAISEVARNIVAYAQRGEIVLSAVEQPGRRGGGRGRPRRRPRHSRPRPGLRDGYSTGNSLGMGLPGARRLMDEFDLSSTVGSGTTVTMRKWTR